MDCKLYKWCDHAAHAPKGANIHNLRKLSDDSLRSIIYNILRVLDEKANNPSNINASTVYNSAVQFSD